MRGQLQGPPCGGPGPAPAVQRPARAPQRGPSVRPQPCDRLQRHEVASAPGIKFLQSCVNAGALTLTTGKLARLVSVTVSSGGQRIGHSQPRQLPLRTRT